MSQRITEPQPLDDCPVCGGLLVLLRVVEDGWLFQCGSCFGLQTLTDATITGGIE